MGKRRVDRVTINHQCRALNEGVTLGIFYIINVPVGEDENLTTSMSW